MSTCNVNVRVTTTANRIDLLNKTIEAFRKQSYVNYKLHIVISRQPYLIDSGIKKAPIFDDERVVLHWAPNTGSYRKMYPIDLVDISKPLITIDDDACYDPNMLEKFMQSYEASQKETIICSMARRQIRNFFGKVTNYESWPLVRNKATSIDLIPIGAGGVLYPPSYLKLPEHRSQRYLELAPTNDDIWFNSIARKYRLPTFVDPNLGKRTAYLEHSFGLQDSNLTKRLGRHKLVKKLHGGSIRLKSYLKIANSPNDEAIRRLDAYFKLSKK
jgi:hypothetical protein